MRIFGKVKYFKHPRCPKCGTSDCLKDDPGLRIEGAGVMCTTSESILKTCMARRQIKVLGELLNKKAPRK